MTWRTTEPEVRAIIPTSGTIDIAPFIEAANALTNYVSSEDGDSVLTTALLLAIEKNLAAHFYESRDPQYQEKKTGDASAVFQGKTEMGLDSSKWGQHAKLLDVSGTLASLDKGKRAKLVWLGLPPSEQTAYADRD